MHNLQPDLKTVSLGLAVVFCAVAVLCFIEEKKNRNLKNHIP